MNAKQLVEKMGNELIGRYIETEAIGEWPGGKARVIEIQPDPEAPEIVMQVTQDSGREYDPIGVFDWEDVIKL